MRVQKEYISDFNNLNGSSVSGVLKTGCQVINMKRIKLNFSFSLEIVPSQKNAVWKVIMVIVWEILPYVIYHTSASQKYISQHIQSINQSLA